MYRPCSNRAAIYIRSCSDCVPYVPHMLPVLDVPPCASPAAPPGARFRTAVKNAATCHGLPMFTLGGRPAAAAAVAVAAAAVTVCVHCCTERRQARHLYTRSHCQITIQMPRGREKRG